jgi:hypothetical protein
MNGPQSTQAAINGPFELRSLPAHTPFTMVIKKKGFSEFRDVDHIMKPSVAGGNIEIYSTIYLTAIRKLTPELILRPFTSTSEADPPYTVAMLSCNIIDDFLIGEYEGYMKILFSNSDTIDITHPDTYQYATPFVSVNRASAGAIIPVYRDTLIMNHFHHGEKIYCKGYYCGLYTKDDGYIDKQSGKKVYTGVSPYSTEVKSFILP